MATPTGGNFADFIVGAHSSGEIRIYETSTLTQRNNSNQPAIQPVLRFRAHKGPVYALEKLDVGNDTLLISGGDDGHLLVWSWKHLLSLCSSSANANGNGVAAGVQPSKRSSGVGPLVCTVQPKLEFDLTPAGADMSLHGNPEVNCIAVEATRKGTVYAGTGDGCWHTIDLSHHSQRSPQETGVKGHSLGILSIDHSSKCNRLVTGSEDGTVRIWDCRDSQCTVAFDPVAEGTTSLDSQAYLGWNRSQCVPCVAFDPEGSWVLCGSDSPSLGFWSLGVGALVHQVSVDSTPQAIAVHEDEIVVVGTKPFVSRFNFQGVQTQRAPVAPRSAFSIHLDPRAQGMLVAGAGSVIQFLSLSCQPLGCITCRNLDRYFSFEEESTSGDAQLANWRF
eukprot:evm.model.scf_1403.3 EVM.evm.TU.scf_1403.3   scf_1403:17934-23476(-)